MVEIGGYFLVCQKTFFAQNSKSGVALFEGFYKNPLKATNKEESFSILSKIGKFFLSHLTGNLLRRNVHMTSQSKGKTFLTISPSSLILLIGKTGPDFVQNFPTQLLERESLKQRRYCGPNLIWQKHFSLFFSVYSKGNEVKGKVFQACYSTM